MKTILLILLTATITYGQNYLVGVPKYHESLSLQAKINDTFEVFYTKPFNRFSKSKIDTLEEHINDLCNILLRDGYDEIAIFANRNFQRRLTQLKKSNK